MRQRYYYYRLVKRVIDHEGYWTGETYLGSLKKVRASSKSVANKLLKRKYKTVPFKLVNRFKAIRTIKMKRRNK